MPPSAALLEALSRLEAARTYMVNLRKNRPDSWKRDYATGRLELQQCIATALSLVDGWLRNAGDPATYARFTELAGKAQSGLSMHQARWPVLIIDHDNAEYNASLAAVNAGFDAVMDFVRTTLKRN